MSEMPSRPGFRPLRRSLSKGFQGRDRETGLRCSCVGPSLSSEIGGQRRMKLGDWGIGLGALEFRPKASSEADGNRCAGEGTGEPASQPSCARRSASSEAVRHRCRGWVRNVGLDASRCSSIRFFGIGSAMAPGGGIGKSPSMLLCVSSPTSSEIGGQRRTGVEAEEPASMPLSVSRSISSELERQRRDGEETDFRLRALSHQLLGLLGGRRHRREGEGTDQPASRCAGKAQTRTRIP